MDGRSEEHSQPALPAWVEHAVEQLRRDGLVRVEVRVLGTEPDRTTGDLVLTNDREHVVISWASHSTTARVLSGRYVFEGVAAQDAATLAQLLLDGRTSIETKGRLLRWRRSVALVDHQTYASDWAFRD